MQTTGKSRTASLLTIALLCGIQSSVFADNRYVWAGSPSPGSGFLTWDTAAHTIQDAVDAVDAEHADTVLVTNGVYDTGGMVTPGHSLYNRVCITRPMTVLSVNGPDHTFIVGAPDPVTGGNGTNAVRGVCIITNAILSGFTITNGYTQSDGDINFYNQSGGGVFCEDASGVLSNCTLSGNAAVAGGGAAHGTLITCTLGGNSATWGGGAFVATLTNCAIIGNTATDGGGVYDVVMDSCTLIGNVAYESGGGGHSVYGTNCTLSSNSATWGGGTYHGTLNNCTVSGNSATGGGGMYQGTLNNCTLSGNSALVGGGASYYSTLTNCTVSGNTATNYGGGASQYSTLNNCILSGNDAGDSGGGADGCTLNNSIVWGNTAPTSNDVYFGSAFFSCSPDLPHGQEGNITNAPQFVTSGDYHLQPTSPCIDAGTNLPWMVGATDLDGNPRIDNLVVDMGAYEYQATAVTAIVVTLPASLMLNDTATLNGSATPLGLPTTAWFEWDLASHAYGNTTLPEIVGSGIDPVSVEAVLSNLTAGLTYHYRCAASNSLGVVYGEDEVFWIPALSLNGGDSITNELGVPFVDPLGTVEATPLALDAGFFYSMALKADGTVAAWGRNNFGQIDVPSNATDVVALAAGGTHALALRADGTVIGWGYNAGGQTTIPDAATNTVAIAAGWAHNLALLSDGAVIGWGSSDDGRTTIPSNATEVVAIAAGGKHSLALRADGTVVGWGNNDGGQTTIPTNATDVVAISAGRYHSLGLRADGTVAAWGTNAQGQTIVPPEATNVVDVSAGIYHNLALRADGTVVAWGQATAPAEATNVVAIAAGGYHNLALLSDGTVLGWGNNVYGQTDEPDDLATLGLAIAVSGMVDTNTPGTYELTYSATNALGAVATAVRTVYVVDSGIEPTVILGRVQLGIVNNVFTFSVEGDLGQLVVIEASQDMTDAEDWDPIQTNVLFLGPWYFSDPESTNHQHRFYRGVTP